jgi:hypothetical protein
MLGWYVLVLRGEAVMPDDLVARWETSVFGLKWLEELVKDGRAKDLGGNGYPCRYSATVSILLPIITSGLPANDSPLVIGDDYALPERWSGNIVWNREVVLACQPDEMLTIEAWDQS